MQTIAADIPARQPRVLVEPNEFGARLRELREARGLTLQQFGDLIGKDYSTISLWEGGERSPDFVMVVKIANKLDINVSEFARQPKSIPHRILGRPKHKPPGKPPKRKR